MRPRARVSAAEHEFSGPSRVLGTFGSASSKAPAWASGNSPVVPLYLLILLAPAAWLLGALAPVPWRSPALAAAAVTAAMAGAGVALTRLWRRKDGEIAAATGRLRESEDGYRTLLELSPDAVLVQREGIVLVASEAAVRLLGASSAADLAGRRLLDLIHADDHPLALDRLRLLAHGDVAPPLAERFLRLDGSVVHVEVAAKRIRLDGEYAIQVVARDVTARRGIQEQLARLATLVEESPNPVVELRGSGEVAYANPSAREHFHDLPQKGLLHEALAGVLDAAQALRAEGRDGLLREVAIEGRLYARQLAVSAHDGSIRLYCFDVTELRHAEEALAMSQEQLRSSQKLEAVGRLAGGIAHDFNNLLTVINGYSELVLADLSPEQPMHAEILEIKKSGERAASLTRQLLAFSRRQVLQPRVLDLNAVVADLERMLRRLIGEDVELATVLDPALGMTRADPSQLEQVLVNLVVNARDAMPRGGRLTVETRDAGIGALDAASHGVQPGRYVLLAVSDDGCGMDAATRDRIFEPFFTTKAGKGNGLGLATAYGIVKQSGGYIAVKTAPRMGTTFNVYLPWVEGEEEEPLPAPPPAVRSGCETVLVVEDDAALRSLVRQVLERSGYTVLEAGDGEAALSTAAGWRQPIHLVITDLVMPKMGGYELVEHLCRTRPALKVLYTSGYAEREALQQEALAPGLAYLPKPFAPGLLLDRVRQVLGG